jgi:hypothetical protein
MMITCFEQAVHSHKKIKLNKDITMTLQIYRFFMGIILFFGTILTVHCENIPVDIHGFLSQGFLQTDRGEYMGKTDDGTFKFNEVGLNVTSNLTDDIHLGIQFISRKMVNYGENFSKIDWAFADYRWRDFLGFRFGKIKMPFGLYNEIRDIDMLRTSILLPSSLYNESWRDTLTSLEGVGIYGNIFIEQLGNINYQALSGQLDVSCDGGVAGYIEHNGMVEISKIEPRNSYMASILWDLPIEGISIGSSYISTKMYETSMTTDHSVYGPIRLGMDITDQLPDQFSQVVVGKTGDINTASMISKNFTDIIVPQGIQSLNNKWPKESFRDHHTLDFWVLSFKYQWQDLNISAERMDFKINNDWILAESGYNLRKNNPCWHIISYYISGTYRLLEWLELGAYYSVFYENDAQKEAEFYQSLNQSEYYQYPIETIYQQSSQGIRQNFKNYANAVFAQTGSGVTLSDDDVENIQLKPDYELEKIKYHDYNGWFKELVFSLNTQINSQWNFKMEGHFIDGVTLLDWTVNGGDIPRKRFLFASKVTFNF